MKKLTALFVVVFAVAFSSNVFAQNTATVTNAVANAKVIAPITLANTVAMNFGTIAKTADGGDVTLIVAANGNATRTFENSEAIATTLSTPSSARFNVTGEANGLYNIALPADNVFSLSGPTGATAMKLKTFTSTVALTAGQLSASGAETFYVGATLEVNGNQTAGEYTGNYTVTVQYQ